MSRRAKTLIRKLPPATDTVRLPDTQVSAQDASPPREDTRKYRRRNCVIDTAVAMSVAALVLLAFNSTGLRSWLRDLPGNATTDILVERADQWHSLMQRAGLTIPKKTIQNAVTEFREASWSDTFPVTRSDAAERKRGDAPEPRE